MIEIKFKNQNEIDSYNKYKELKGIEYHQYIAKYLNTDEYSKIAAVIQYDLRLKYILYRYICFFEEYIRAVLMNCEIKDVEFFLKENVNMSEAQNLYYKHINKIQTKYGDRPLIPRNEFDGIRELRNQISHFKPIILDNIFENQMNINFLYNNLTKNYQSNFKNEINMAGNEIDLVDQVKIKFDI
ncbi:hypothetical protein MENTO_v1c03380 [Mesoplasma entomophilum]|uniref:Uncharacterized protein n=1 Tax=Mesoplasma entomophilum TaxID=2149 RepID=A0A3S5XYX8_9MOLU|nr:hypothetical protein [Mesoplasma entomophilum]ATQ35484.1 hypothetical protein CS528_01745 [Mesoplasma entomophilum]ATZ19444.1 hypothetical protein MENTO_v1c03380 [Mesoplasma entomophilum]